MNFKEEQQKRTAEINEIIDRFLPQEEGYQRKVLAAMNYSIRSGGKRIRPMLMEETFRMFGGTESLARRLCHPFMAALEMIHTYSLVHDDLPAMDDDEYRRGRKTTHIVYGEGMSILAGDGLLNLAFETAVKAYEGITGSGTGQTETMNRVTTALTILGRKAGVMGMIGGQAADILAEETDGMPEEELLYFIHEHKTAALFQSAMMIGAVLAGAGPEENKKLERAAYCIGVAFQIQDDILDATSTFEELGKPIGSDDKNRKLTFVSLKGLEESRKEVEYLSQEAIVLLKSLKHENPFLFQLIEEMVHRRR